jgi:hypothetical protein
MKDEKEEFHARKIEMWKKREELLKSMDEKELRAFIKGYMMGQRSILKQMNSECGCTSGGCCREESSCGCGKEGCGCGKE